MVWFEAFVGFICGAVCSALESCLQISAMEALAWFRNWVAQRVQGEAMRDRVILQPQNSPYSIVGAEDALSNFRRFLDHDDCRIIGIYGMGGIGKTTLLRKINNEFFETRSNRFDLVLFITVTRDIRVDLVQKDILDRLGLDKESSRPRETIFNALSQKKFLLLLDNLWAELELGEIGIPVFPDSKQGSKIAFTTRSAEVCNDMGAAGWKIEMPHLSWESSWELFCQSLGLREDQLTKSTREIAEEVASKCEGLPLALITVGRAMADVTNSREWEAALVTLRGTAVGIRNMEERVLRNLQFSFDRLKYEHHKECLLYCSLFPENFGIRVSNLIEYWVGEGLLEEGDRPCSIDTARGRGFNVITALKAACLLQDGGYNGRCVKLHDVVRQMALWITSGNFEGENQVFLVNSWEGLERAPMPERWTNSTRISLMENSISELPERPHCLNLRTLLLNVNRPLRQIPGGFFQYMPILTVLDLSYTGLNLLPPEINLLVELRFLDLSWTKLESLPREVGGLTKLRQLNLNGTTKLKRIPREAISSLSCLQSLTTLGGMHNWGGGWKDDGDNGGAERCLRLKDLAGLEKLDEFDLDIKSASQEDLQALLDCRRVCSVIRYLRLRRLENSSSLELCEFFGAIKDMICLCVDECIHLTELIFPANQLTKLEDLVLRNLPLQTISWKNDKQFLSQPTQGASFKNLQSLEIFNCDSLEEITWTKELPCLYIIILSKCPKMVEMIVVDESVMKGVDQAKDNFFPQLWMISLENMQNLKSICQQPLLFPALEAVHVDDCPELKKLPFGPSSAKKLQEIMGGQQWWNDLEWDNERIPSKFTPRVKRNEVRVSHTHEYLYG